MTHHGTDPDIAAIPWRVEVLERHDASHEKRIRVLETTRARLSGAAAGGAFAAGAIFELIRFLFTP